MKDKWLVDTAKEKHNANESAYSQFHTTTSQQQSHGIQTLRFADDFDGD